LLDSSLLPGVMALPFFGGASVIVCHGADLLRPARTPASRRSRTGKGGGGGEDLDVTGPAQSLIALRQSVGMSTTLPRMVDRTFSCSRFSAESPQSN
jgi:hypothetical protein